MLLPRFASQKHVHQTYSYSYLFHLLLLLAFNLGQLHLVYRSLPLQTILQANKQAKQTSKKTPTPNVQRGQGVERHHVAMNTTKKMTLIIRVKPQVAHQNGEHRPREQKALPERERELSKKTPPPPPPPFSTQINPSENVGSNSRTTKKKRKEKTLDAAPLAYPLPLTKTNRHVHRVRLDHRQ